MNTSLYAGPVAFAVEWASRYKPRKAEAPFLKCFYKKGDTPWINAQIRICDPIPSLSIAPDDAMTLAENWRIWKTGDEYLFQVWNETYKAYVLETRFSAAFDRAEIRPISALRERANLPFVLATSIHWMMVHLLVRNNGFLLHGAALQEVNSQNVILGIGPSGAGKTTFSRFFLNQPDFRILTDETSAIIQDPNSDRFFCFGTPWYGMLGIGRNIGGPIETAFFLEKKSEHQIRMGLSEIRPLQLFKEIFLPPWNEDVSQKALQTVSRFLMNVPCGVLGFKKSKTITDYTRNWHYGRSK